MQKGNGFKTAGINAIYQPLRNGWYIKKAARGSL
jgi:hypothetical protein